MEGILRAIFDIVIWTIVPIILITAIVKSYGVAKHIEQKEFKIAARSGFVGGVVLFLTFVIYQLGQFVQYGFPDKAIYQGFNPYLAILFMLGTFALFYGKRSVSAKFVGWVVLTITFAALWTLFHYLFIHTANEYILSIVLGIAFGIFSHTAFSPITIDDLVKFF